jgi:hypothetical protein
LQIGPAAEGWLIKAYHSAGRTDEAIEELAHTLDRPGTVRVRRRPADR